MFRIGLRDKIIIGIRCLNFPLNIISAGQVVMCQSCQDLIFKGGSKKRFRICRVCGIIVCDDCVYSRRLFLKKRYWCRNCEKELKLNNISFKKNKVAQKSFKRKYMNWKRQNKWTLEFIKS